MAKKILFLLGSMVVVVFGVVLISAGEAWVVNVTATIENALEVHGLTQFDFGTMFPQEYREESFFELRTSDSFSDTNQTRVLNIDYQIKQKPKPRPEFIARVGLDTAREWCHINVNEPNFLTNCYPVLCPYLSKKPQHSETGDVGLPPFHGPNEVATGKLKKWSDLSDQWIIDLAVPCFEGQCAQDWPDFVHQHNPTADPNEFMAPEGLSGQKFGCDLWIETTKIY